MTTNARRRRATRSLGILLFVLPSACLASDYMLSRNLHCERFELARSQEICRALEREMEWTWLGHAIISPGFRPTWNTLTRVFCALHVQPQDAADLVALATWYPRKGELSADDWRLRDAATDLLKMMGKSALDALPVPGSMQSDWANMKLRYLKQDLELTLSDEKFILNPSSPHYILRDGCPK